MTEVAGQLTLRDGSAAPVPAVLEVWANLDGGQGLVAPDSALDFAVAGPRSASEPVWLVKLPRDSIEAGNVLADAEARQGAAGLDLRAAGHRLQVEAAAGGSPGSFTLSGFDGAAGRPEAGLRAALADVGLAAAGSAPDGMTAESFDPFFQALDLRETAGGFWDGVRRAWTRQTGEWALAATTFGEALDRTRRLFGLRSWVETAMGGIILARTSLGSGGDTITVWSRGATPREHRLHVRAVQLALAGRESLLRSISLAMRGAALVTGLISSPAGALLALPAVWRFLDDVVMEARGLQPLWQDV